MAAMDIAKKAGCILSYDPNLRLPLWPSEDSARKGIMSIWDQADFVKVYVFHSSKTACLNDVICKLWSINGKLQVSEDEIKFLTEGDDPYDDKVVMEKLFRPHMKLLLVTEGNNGCRYYTQVIV